MRIWAFDNLINEKLQESSDVNSLILQVALSLLTEMTFMLQFP